MYWISEITIPASVTAIGTQPFYKSNIKTIYYYSNYSDSSNPIFAIKSIEKIVLGKYIPTAIITSANNIKSVIIEGGVTSIGSYAFYYCNLTSITIPDSVTSIGYRAFLGCYNITNVYYTGTEEQWKKISIDSGNGELTSITRTYNYK